MALTQEQKKQFKSIGHHLKPDTDRSRERLTEALSPNSERALNDHELIKVKLALAERDDRRAPLDESCAQSRSDLVQSIGKMALVYRKNPKPNKNLSNISRFAGI
ncbi:YhbY family RNA-binding protein [Pseudomonas aeruginosa]